MKDTDSGRHLTDSEIFRCLDDDATASERARCERHTRECSSCSDQLAALRSDSRLVREWLERAAFEEAAPAAGWAAFSGRRSRLAPWLRAAAILTLLAAPVAAIPALRGWVVEQVARPGPTPETGAPVTAIEEGSIVRFVPDPGEFQVVFDPDATGALTLASSPGDAAMLRSSAPTPETTVSSSQLRLRSLGGGDYVLRLPGSITAVRVMIGDRSVWVTASEIRRGTVVALEDRSLEDPSLEDRSPR